MTQPISLTSTVGFIHQPYQAHHPLTAFKPSNFKQRRSSTELVAIEDAVNHSPRLQLIYNHGEDTRKHRAQCLNQPKLPSKNQKHSLVGEKNSGQTIIKNQAAQANPIQQALSNAQLKLPQSVMKWMAPLLLNAVLSPPANAFHYPGPKLGSTSQDLLLSLASACGAALWVSLWGHLSKGGQVDSKLSRKIIHTTSAPLFVLTWPLFSQQHAARFIAAAVPALQMLRLIKAAKGEDSSLTAAVARTAKSSELLKGPAIYAAILMLATLNWRSQSSSLCVIAQMAVGDGVADIIGRRLARKDGTGKIPWNKNKSVAGTSAFIIGATAATIGLMSWFHHQGCVAKPEALIAKALALSAACALIETIPEKTLNVDDNISVPIAAAILGTMFFHQS